MISFIIPCHNYGMYLEKCIKSILQNNQYLVKEILIINDSSTDNTKKIVKNISKLSKKIKYFEKNFKNLSKTVNFAISKCETNSVITKIDADDYIKKNYVNSLWKYFTKNELDFLYSNFIVKEKKKKDFLKRQKIRKYFNSFLYPHGSGCLFKKTLWLKAGGYNENIFYQDDYDFWLKIKKLDKIRIGYLDKALYVYNKHNKNMSKNFLRKNITKLKIYIKNLL